MLKNIGKASGRMLTRSQIGLFSSKDLIVQHDPKNLTFFVELNSEKAFLEYTKENGVFNLKHTFVPEVFKGKQIGNLLAKTAFDHISDSGSKTKVECTFLHHYLNKYGTEYKQLVI